MSNGKFDEFNQMFAVAGCDFEIIPFWSAILKGRITKHMDHIGFLRHVPLANVPIEFGTSEHIMHIGHVGHIPLADVSIEFGYAEHA